MVKLSRRKLIAASAGVLASSAMPVLANTSKDSKIDKPPIVLVHGAWHGAWAWIKTTPLLIDAGYSVTPLDLSGLGANYHRQSPDIGMHVHGQDILNHLYFNDIRDAVVVGHSYGGAALSQAVANDQEQRITHAVYLDAFLPDKGESVAGFQPKENQAQFELAAEKGSMIPARAQDTWEKYWGLKGENAEWSAPRMKPMSARCFTEAVEGEPFSSGIRRTYMRCTQNDNALFDKFSEKAKNDNRFIQIDVDGHHNVMVIDPIVMRDSLIGAL